MCPPFTALRTVQTLLDSDRLPYALGAQNVHPEEEGAFTGEVSPLMLKALHVRLRHRRPLGTPRSSFGETDEIVNRKVRAVFANDMTPILCVGETLQERDARRRPRTEVTEQVRAALAGVGEAEAARLVVAYEPIWAIGTGRNAEPSDAGQVIGLIRATIAELYDGGGRGRRPRPVRGQREGGEHPGLHGAPGDRRRARRRREPRSRGVRADREVPVMRRLLYVCLDGLGDDPIPELDDRTPLEAAATPFLDSLARRGRTGTVVTVGEGIAPGVRHRGLRDPGLRPARGAPRARRRRGDRDRHGLPRR